MRIAPYWSVVSEFWDVFICFFQVVGIPTTFGTPNLLRSNVVDWLFQPHVPGLSLRAGRPDVPHQEALLHFECLAAKTSADLAQAGWRQDSVIIIHYHVGIIIDICILYIYIIYR